MFIFGSIVQIIAIVAVAYIFFRVGRWYERKFK